MIVAIQNWPAFNDDNDKYNLYDVKTQKILLILEKDGNLQILPEYNNIANLLKNWLINIINTTIPNEIYLQQFDLDKVIANIKQQQREQKINNLLENDNTDLFKN